MQPQQRAGDAREARGLPLPWHDSAEQDSEVEVLSWGWSREACGRFFEITAQPLPGVDPPADLLLFHNVTDRCQLEQQLFQAARQATAGILASSIGHEINNVLVGLMGYTDLALMRLDECDFVCHTLEILSQQLERIGRQTDTLLSLSRPQSDEMVEFDLAEVIEGTLHLLSHSSRVNRCRLRRSIQEGLPPIRGNRALLQQLFANLLLNAADAVGNDGEITVTLSREEDDGRLHLAVTDASDGGSHSQGNPLAGPPLASRPPGQGTGLGMLVVRRVAEKHGAEIRIDAGPNGGTTVHVFFPIVR